MAFAGIGALSIPRLGPSKHDYNIVVGIKTWGQIIEENKARLQFFQERLEHQVDDATALAHLQQKYQSFLSGVVPEGDADAD